MEDAVSNGVVRQLGVSKQGRSDILTLAHMDRIFEEARLNPALTQTRYNSKQQDFDLAWCASADVVLQSFATLTSNMHILDSKTMTNLAKKYGVAPRVLFFRYMMSLGVMPLITPTIENMSGDAAAWR